MNDCEYKMKEHIKSILSENPLHSPEGINPSGKFSISDMFNFNTYMEILQEVYKDLYYEGQLDQWLSGEDMQADGSDSFPDINSPEAKNAFDESFHYLTANWHKFTAHSPGTPSWDAQVYNDTDIDFPFSVFKAIYKRCPSLCVNVFPVVIFIIADSFYAFCKIGYTGKKHLLPRQLSPQKEDEIYGLFYDLMNLDNKEKYLFSLLNSKGVFYSESSLEIGEEIQTLVQNKYKEHETAVAEYIRAEYAPDNIDQESASDADDIIDKWLGYIPVPKEYCTEKKLIKEGVHALQKRFYDNLYKKEKNRQSRSTAFPTGIMVGENFLAFLNLLINQPDNIWRKNVDKAASLYTINYITGWIAIYLLHNTYPAANPEYGLSLFDNKNLYTLYFITNMASMDHYDEEDTTNACMQQLLSDCSKIIDYALEEFSSFHIDDHDDTAELICSSFSYTLKNIKKSTSYAWFKFDRLANMAAYHVLNQIKESIIDEN